MTELSATELQQMYQTAKSMLDKSYSPYSKFKVGCCLKSAQGNYYSGCNIENASYSLVQCAEGCAVSHMIAAGEQEIVAIVLTSSGDLTCGPCGACRQILREFSKPDILIYMYDNKGNYQMKKLSELLPFSFGPENLS